MTERLRSSPSEKVLLNLKEQVMPYSEKLKRQLGDEKLKTYLDTIEANLKSVTHRFPGIAISNISVSRLRNSMSPASSVKAKPQERLGIS